MAKKPTYEELEKRIGELEAETDQHRLLEKKLQEGEARFRAFMNYYPAVIYIKDEEGKHLFTNNAGLKVMNTTKEDFLGTTSWDLFPPNIAKEIKDHDTLVLKRGVPTDLEYQYKMPDGQVHWFKDIKFPILLAEQTMLGGIAVDINELKRAEQALREQLEFERVIADIAAKLALTGPEELGEVINRMLETLGRFLKSERAFLVEFSEDSNQLLTTNRWAAEGISIESSIFEIDLAHEIPWVAQTIRNNEMIYTGADLSSLPDEAKDLRKQLEKDGINSGLVVPVRVEDQAIGMLGLDTLVHTREYPQAIIDRLKILADMIGSTLHRVRAQRDLQQYQHIVETTKNMVGLVDQNYIYLYVNQPYCDAFNKEPDDITGLKVADLSGQEMFDSVLKQQYDRCFAGEVVAFQSWFDFPGWGNRFMNIHYSPFFGSGREVSAVVVSAHDITERKEVEKALQESQQDLQRLAGKLISTQEAERRRLAREMHDDISQRLAILAIDAGKLERLFEDSTDPIVEALQNMKERLVNLSTDIHAISRQLHPSILDDLGLVDAVRAECEGFTRREGIKINYKTETVPSNLPKDVALSLFRIVQEGLRNVAKHAQTEKIKVSLHGKDDSIHLNIIDDGVGFDYSNARKKPGLGLGSMEERIRLIKGDISIKSKPGKGTMIEVRTPLGAE